MQVTGHVIRSRHTFVRKAGKDAYQRVLDALGPEARKVMEEGPLETVWYPFEVLLDLSVTADRVLGQGDLQLCEEMGSFSCEHNLTGIYRMFFRFGNLDFLLSRAAKAWRSQYDFGSVQLLRDPDNSRRITLELSGVPRPHRAHYLAVKGWAMKAADLSGTEMVDFVDGFSPDPDTPSTWLFEYL